MNEFLSVLKLHFSEIDLYSAILQNLHKITEHKNKKIEPQIKLMDWVGLIAVLPSTSITCYSK